MGKKIVRIMLLFILIFSLVLVIKTHIGKNDLLEENISIKNKLEVDIKHMIDNGKLYISLNDVTDFNWNKLIIISPYMDYERFLKNRKLEYKQINSPIQVEDDICLLIFYKDNKMLDYVNYKRNKGDFSFNKKKEYSNREAVFSIVLEDNGWIVLKY